MSVHSERPDIFKTLLDLRIYLIPTGRNDIGCFLAYADKMYLRQVFSAFVDVPAFAPMFPRDTYGFGGVKEAALGSRLPAMLQKDAFEDYMRFADQVYPVTVWSCICWDDHGAATPSSLSETTDDTGALDVIDTLNAEPTTVIPFCGRYEGPTFFRTNVCLILPTLETQFVIHNSSHLCIHRSAEIGIHAQMAAYQKKHKTCNGFCAWETLEELLSDKKATFSKECLEQVCIQVAVWSLRNYRNFVP